MSIDCIVYDSDNPDVTLPSRYVVQSGDTLTAIAARFGFQSWRDIYHHADNEAFRKKRPNPDKIFPGDVLVIPGRPMDPSQLPVVAGGGPAFIRFTASDSAASPRTIETGRLDS